LRWKAHATVPLVAGALGALLTYPPLLANGLAAQTPTAPLPRCHTSHLSVVFVDADAAAGHIADRFHLTNTSAAPCQLYGFVGAQMLDATGQPLPTQVRRNGGFFANQPGPADVPLMPGQSAEFLMMWGDVPVGDESRCPAAAQVAITPPDETSFLLLDLDQFALAPCNGGTIDVTPVGAVDAPKAGE